MKEGFGDYAVCLICEHYRIAHNQCCVCKKFIERDLVLSTLDRIIYEGGSVEPIRNGIVVSKDMLKLISGHLRKMTIEIIKRDEKE